MLDFCIIGSGISGSTIANFLSKKYSVQILDKARGPGGRASNKRLKDNLKPIENSLDKLSKLSGYEFDWNDKQETFKGHDVGVVAQEVEEVLPEIVTTRDNGYKAVKYEKLVPLLIESIKELKAEIEELKK